MHRASERSPELEETFLALRRVMAALRGRFHAALREHGLTFPQWALLKSLARAPRLTTSELADACGVTPANVTGIVDRLEEARLVARERSPDDRRVVYVALTEQGREKVEQVIGVAETSLSGFFEGWSDEELAALRGSLGRLKIRPEDQAEF